jgi:hypothetical protein
MVAAVPETTGLTISLVAGKAAVLSGEHMKPRLDIPGVALVSGGLFCLVYGFSNPATHGWHTPSTYGFLAAEVVLLAVFALWQGRAAHPLLPPRVLLYRNRGGAYLTMLVSGAALSGVFLFLTYYLQQLLGYSPVITTGDASPSAARSAAAIRRSSRWPRR